MNPPGRARGYLRAVVRGGQQHRLTFGASPPEWSVSARISSSRPSLERSGEQGPDLNVGRGANDCPRRSPVSARAERSGDLTRPLPHRPAPTRYATEPPTGPSRRRRPTRPPPDPVSVELSTDPDGRGRRGAAPARDGQHVLHNGHSVVRNRQARGGRRRTTATMTAALQPAPVVQAAELDRARRARARQLA